ncbi:hypothetical protein JTB14_009873 [Gonioctena quinquepunctata]|nr:hypothetical protein JTB14_009873 [Gonioctena quinquepunctata]
MVVTVSDAILKAKDVNVFRVDWSKFSNKNYVEAFIAAPYVGRLLGEFIKRMVKNNGLKLKRSTIVGHSLGAHIGGRAGADLEGQIGVIVGLDPAGPMFLQDITGNRLASSNAKFVQVIHTSGLFGYQNQLGHADYYPNGGEIQAISHIHVPIRWLSNIMQNHYLRGDL